MNTLQEIKKENIKKKVMSEISKASIEILATMDITEEKYSPLPVEYFLLLKKKFDKGVKIKRIIFGTTIEYRKFSLRMETRGIFFTGLHTRSKNYNRMILIDNKKLFFRKDKHFYFSNDEKQIGYYKKYFKKFYN